MEISTIIGLSAGALTTLAEVPQLIKSWKTKKTNDIALGWCIILSVGIFLWLIYGLMVKDVPVIIANLITLILMLGILALKLKYG